MQWQLWEGALTAKQCEDIISFAEEFPVNDAGIFAGSEKIDSVRRSKVRWLPKESNPAKTLFNFAVEANRNAFGFDIAGLWEIQFTEYRAEDVGFYDWHHDIDWKSGKPFARKLSVVIQLSDPNSYEGGDFNFAECESPVKFKTQGSVIVFPSYLSHKVSEVTSGTRRSLVGWVEGPRWK